jgi:hypothetical protein
MADKINPPPLPPLGAFEDVHALEHAIGMLAHGMKALSDSRLRRSTIILLLQDATGLGKKQIDSVLTALSTLEKTYLKPVA